jgi:hypothetical protein
MLQQLVRGSSASIPRRNLANRCRVSTAEAARDLVKALSVQHRPLAGLYDLARGHRILWSPHNPG